jgi:hypothetical protein
MQKNLEEPSEFFSAGAFGPGEEGTLVTPPQTAMQKNLGEPSEFFSAEKKDDLVTPPQTPLPKNPDQSSHVVEIPWQITMVDPVPSKTTKQLQVPERNTNTIPASNQNSTSKSPGEKNMTLLPTETTLVNPTTLPHAALPTLQQKLQSPRKESPSVASVEIHRYIQQLEYQVSILSETLVCAEAEVLALFDVSSVDVLHALVT